MMQFLKTLLRTPLLTILRNIAILYICFMICRVVFVWYNWELYSPTYNSELILSTIKGGLIFDTAAIMYISALYSLLTIFPLHTKECDGYHKFVRWTLIIPASIAIIMNLIDTVYYQYSGKRTTIEIFNEFANETNICSIILKEIINNWHISLIGILLIVLLIVAIRRPTTLRFRNLALYYPIRMLSMALIAFITVVGMRGGCTSSHPITLSNANQYVNRPVEAIAVLNTPFCFVRTLDKGQMQIPTYYDNQTLDSIFSAVIEPDTTTQFKSMNVVVFILESFGTEYIGALNGIERYGYTPFLDSLIEHSLTFSASFANGRKSIDAMPSILSGIPMFVENFVLTPTLVNKDVSGLAEELAHKGYYSAFFHGADNSSMGFQSYARSIGFTDYYGLSEYCADSRYKGMSDFDGLWAIWDEEFLQFFCDKMGEFSEPFVTSIFTASSHHPFSIPDRYRDRFKGGNLPIHRCIEYSDNALRLFFEKAKEQAWFENTLFVLTADHTNQSENREFQTDLGRFRAPIIFYSPGRGIELKAKDGAIAQQIDILPSILGLLGYDRPFICFGENLFDSSKESSYAVNYINGVYQYIEGDYLLHFDGESPMALYNYKRDATLQYNIKEQHPDIVYNMSLRLKAIIQQYMERMNYKSLVY